MVGSQLQKLQGSTEDQIGIGHIFSADCPPSCKMTCRRDILIDHRISSASPVILRSHLFAQFVFEPVGRPRLPFRDITMERTVQRMHPSAIGLDPRKYAQRPTPLLIRDKKAFIQQFCLCPTKIVTNPFHPITNLIGHLHAIMGINYVTHATGLEHSQRQHWDRIIPPPTNKLVAHIVTPVGTLQFETIHK